MKFRKLPVVVEAFQMTEARRNDNAEWPHWLNEAWNLDPGLPGAFFIDRPVGEPERLLIHTLEGAHVVTYGDWIIRGVKGELYPCKPDVFAMTYEVATPVEAERRESAEDAKCGGPPPYGCPGCGGMTCCRIDERGRRLLATPPPESDPKEPRRER